MYESFSEAARVPAHLRNAKSLERRRQACGQRKGVKLQGSTAFICSTFVAVASDRRVHVAGLCGCTTQITSGWQISHGRFKGIVVVGLLEAIVVRSPLLKCCTTSLKISHASGLWRNPPPSSPPSNERAALPATDSPTVPPAPSGFKFSTGATPIYHSSQSRAEA